MEPEYTTSILESMLDAVIVANPDGTIRTVNRAALELLGYSEEELIGQAVGIIFEEEEEEEAAFFRGTGLAQLVREGAARDVELMLLAKSGERIPVMFNGSVIREEDGRLAAVVGVARDIRERKRAEEQLRYQAALLANVNDAIVASDAQYRLTAWNAAAESLYGWKAEQVLGQFGLDITQTEYPDVDKAEMLRIIAEIGRWRGEVTQARKDGTRIPVEISSMVLRDESGQITGYVSVNRDITERKRAEEALRETKDYLDSLIRYANAPIIVWDTQGRITRFNHAFEHLTGYTAGEVIGQQLHMLFPETSRDELLHEIAHTLSGEYWESVEIPVLRKDGNVQLVLWNSANTYAEDGTTLLATIAQGIDITERKRAEEELQDSLEKLRQALGGTIQAIALIVETRDPYTAGHQRRVADLARAIATEMGLSKEQIDGIRMAGVIHDIGKISLPAEILSKPGRLSAIEWGMIKAHPQIAYDVLKQIDFPWPVAQIVLQHHERLDGSGYPQGLSEEDILLEARILAVADVVEAMSSFRPYRPALGTDKALEEISQNRGVLYAPEVVDACLKLFAEKGFEFE